MINKWKGLGYITPSVSEVRDRANEMYAVRYYFCSLLNMIKAFEKGSSIELATGDNYNIIAKFTPQTVEIVENLGLDMESFKLKLMEIIKKIETLETQLFTEAAAEEEQNRSYNKKEND